jgi:hypothetical protein
MTLEMEIIGALASASMALFSILVAVIGILFAIYSGLSKESYIRDPFKKLINFMTYTLILGGITCFLFIACLLGVPHVFLYYLAVGSFILLVLMVIMGVFRVKKEVLKRC